MFVLLYKHILCEQNSKGVPYVFCRLGCRSAGIASRCSEPLIVQKQQKQNKCVLLISREKIMFVELYLGAFCSLIITVCFLVCLFLSLLSFIINFFSIFRVLSSHNGAAVFKSKTSHLHHKATFIQLQKILVDIGFTQEVSYLLQCIGIW